MRKTLIILVTLAVVVLTVAVLSQRLLTRPAKELGPAALGESSPRGNQEVAVRGVVVPVRWEKMSFSSGGQLEGLAVKVGDVVAPQQVLASLATQELELEVELARSDLEAQEANLARLQGGESSPEFVSAQAGYDAAIAAYEKLKAGPSEQEIAIADAELKQAERALQRAQAAYDAVHNLPDIGARPESMQLELATIAYQRANAAHDLAVAKPDLATLKQAESQVALAKARLGSLAGELRVAQASVARANVSLAQAQLALDRATLRAPITGTVTTVDVQPGEMVGPGSPALTIADLSELQVETADLDEWGAANIKPNQSVDLWIPSLDNRNLRGKLVSVAMEPTVSPTGAVFYKAIIALEKQDAGLRWGMTVRIRFVKLTGGLQG